MFYQTNDLGLYVGESAYGQKGFGDVAVAPPAEVPAGNIAQWVSTVHRAAMEFGDAGTGQWETVEDHRKDDLYIDSGEKYEIGSEHEGQIYDGMGPIPAWLSATQPPAPEPTLAGAQAAQLALINRSFETAAQALTAGYPEAERLTWPIQQAEALAWLADENAATPYLDGLATARGISSADMRTLTLAQVQAFQAASQQLVGTRQRLRDEINAAETVAAVLAVVWPGSGSQA